MSRKVLLTGSSSGIGESTARLLLRQDYKVLGIARDFAKSTLKHSNYEQVCRDLSQLDDLEAWLKPFAKQHSDIDTLILNAGRGLLGGLEQFSFKQIRSLMDINLLSPIAVTRAFLPLFKQRKQGHLIFLGSEAALQGKREGSVYCASKFALRGFVQALREETANSGVRVSLVNPGVVDTPFFDDLPIRPGEQPQHSLKAEDVAKVILSLLEAEPHVVIDEVNLSPMKQQIQRGMRVGS